MNRLSVAIPLAFSLLAAQTTDAHAQEDFGVEKLPKKEIGPEAFTKRFDDKVVGVRRVPQMQPEQIRESIDPDAKRSGGDNQADTASK